MSTKAVLVKQNKILIQFLFELGAGVSDRRWHTISELDSYIKTERIVLLKQLRSVGK